MAEINIAKQLLAARHEKKITQEELASYVGVSGRRCRSGKVV